MVSTDVVRRIAGALPEVQDRSNDKGLHFRVRGKLLAWTPRQRAGAKGPRDPDLTVLVVRCDVDVRDIMMEAEPGKFFVTSHYAGYPAMLVRLDEVGEDELRGVLISAWRHEAPPGLARQLEL